MVVLNAQQFIQFKENSKRPLKNDLSYQGNKKVQRLIFGELALKQTKDISPIYSGRLRKCVTVFTECNMCLCHRLSIFLRTEQHRYVK